MTENFYSKDNNNNFLYSFNSSRNSKKSKIKVNNLNTYSIKAKKINNKILSLSNCHDKINKSFNIKKTYYHPYYNNKHINLDINSDLNSNKIRAKILNKNLIFINQKPKLQNIKTSKNKKNQKKIHNLSSRLNLISNLTKTFFISKDFKEKNENVKTKCIHIKDVFNNKKNNINDKNNLTLKNKNNCIFIGNSTLNKEKIYKKLLVNCKENNYKLFIIKQLKNEIKYLCSNDNNMFTIEIIANNNLNNKIFINMI
jgi:hypothetical protein